MIKNKIYNGYCPLCGEFITTKLDGDAIVVKHKKYVTLYHKKCYEFSFISESEENRNGYI